MGQGHWAARPSTRPLPPQLCLHQPSWLDTSAVSLEGTTECGAHENLVCRELLDVGGYVEQNRGCVDPRGLGTGVVKCMHGLGASAPP